jgi:hypothetical protein
MKITFCNIKGGFASLKTREYLFASSDLCNRECILLLRFLSEARPEAVSKKYSVFKAG